MENGKNTGYLLEHVASLMYRQSDQMLQELLGVGMSQYKLLMILLYEPKARQRTLAGRLGQTEASISRQVKLLSDKGMLASYINPDNRREHAAVLTQKGLKVTVAADEALARYHEDVLGQLDSKQRRQLHEALLTIHTKAYPPIKQHDCGPPFVTTDYI